MGKSPDSVIFFNMKKSFVPKTYVCKCGAHTKEYVWASELADKKIKCKNCMAELGYNDIPKIESAAAIRTPTKNR